MKTGYGPVTPRWVADQSELSLWVGRVHIDTSTSDVRQFADILESFHLDQRVDFPTHIHGHSLDLMTFSKGFDVLSVSVSDKISNQFSIVANLNIPRNNNRTVPTTSRTVI